MKLFIVGSPCARRGSLPGAAQATEEARSHPIRWDDLDTGSQLRRMT